MDDPLVPTEYGSGTKWTGSLAVGASLTFILVTIILAMASVKASWIVVAIGMSFLLGGTSTLIYWIKTGHLEEARHTYLAACQVLALIIVCGAFLDLLYSNTKEFAVVGTVTGAFPSPNIKDGGSVSFNDGEPIKMPQGYVMPVVFAEAVPDGTSVNIKVVTQPGQALCSVSGSGSSINTGVYNMINVSCVPAYNVGGTVQGIKPEYAGLVISATYTGFTPTGAPPPSTRSEIAVAQNGQFFFPDKVYVGWNFQLMIATNPTSSDGKDPQTCAVTQGNGGSIPSPPNAPSDFTSIVVQCS